MPALAKSQEPAFVCLCSEKTLQLSCDKKLERAFQSLALKRHLEELGARMGGSSHLGYTFLPGAGVVFNSETCSCSLDGVVLTVATGYAFLRGLQRDGGRNVAASMTKVATARVGKNATVQ